MLKVLILLVFVAGFSLFLTDASSLEVEFLPEEDRIIESMGWIEPEKMSFQEQLQIIIDDTDSKNRVSIGFLSKNPNDLRFPEYLERITTDKRIQSFTITNQFGCAPNEIERSCIIIDIEREGLGDTITEIRENTRKVTDKIVEGGVIIWMPEFESVLLHPKITSDGDKVIISRATYTINKQTSDELFNALGKTILSSDIITNAGFFVHAEEMTRNYFSDFNLSLIQQDDYSLLRSMQVSLICSDLHPEYVRCPPNVSMQLENSEINPLDFIEAESIERSGLFKDQFLPLNSIIQVIIFSEEDLQVKSVNTSIIEKLHNLGDVQNDGWFFKKSNKKIEGKYLFGQEMSVSKNELIFSIGPNTGEPIKVNEVNVNDGGGCLIATATFDSELAPQVQLLREVRDNTILQTESGSIFMTGFNQFYYSFSPTVADYERENPAFKEIVKMTLTPLLISLTLLQYVDVDSESEMLGYGIGIILLNIGMYFVAPAILIMKIKKLV